MATSRARDPNNNNNDSDEDDDFRTLVSEQLHELMAANALESDLDFAFCLQLQEALSASLVLQPPAAAAANPPRNDDAPRPAVFEVEQTSQLSKELSGREEDLHRRIPDQRAAREILTILDDGWSDNIARPFGEGSSKSGIIGIGRGDCGGKSEGERVEDSVYGVYFKGLVSEEERIGRGKTFLAGIGVAICDPRKNLIFEVRKPLFGNGFSRSAVEAKALIEGLNAALALDLKRITVYCDNFALYKFISGRWLSKQQKVAVLVDEVKSLQSKFQHCETRLLARNEIKFAFKLAKEAIQSQVNKAVESSHRKNTEETCVICLEDTDLSQILTVHHCLHRYCFSCMKQHVETKLREALMPKCPHDGCRSELDVDSCKKFLTPKFIEIMLQRKKEATTPVTERVYCPNPRCSVLMSKIEVSEHARRAGLDVDGSEARICLKCSGVFCVNCKVPWHRNMTCSQYKRLNPNLHVEDAKLKLLASRNLWRQCPKCNLMIELAEGCYHMTCRCGNEFCYKCGAPWKDKKATCSCPLWDVHHIWRDQNIDSDDDDDDDDEEEEEEEEEEYDDFDDDMGFYI